MNRYDIRFLNASDVVVLIQTYIGPDDCTAQNAAQRLSATHTIEVWEGERKVARIERKNISVFRNDQTAG